MSSCNPNFRSTMDSRPNLAHLDFSPSFFTFSPLVFNQDFSSSFHDLVLPPQLIGAGETLPRPTTPTPDPLPPIKEVLPSPGKKTSSVTRKRTTRKDRHSKIVTAQGPRDRRMRLNLEVAKRFFDIQDMLGHDKASKTVQWLMKEAKASIEKLKVAAMAAKGQSLSRAGGSPKSIDASSSELEYCEDISAIASEYNGKARPDNQEEEDVTVKAKKATRRPSRRTLYPSALSRELRAMARARARERTRAKNKTINLQTSGSTEWNELISASSQDLKSSLDLLAEVEGQCSPSINQIKQGGSGDGGRVNELSVSIMDYNSTTVSVCPNGATNNLFSEEQWEVNQFASVEDVQTPLWQA